MLEEHDIELEVGMRNKRGTALVGALVAFAAGAFVLAVPGQAQSNALAMLDGLTKGEWTLRYRDGSSSRKICVRKGDELIQLQHDDRDCSRFVIEDSQAEVTVQYTCRGNGYGRTNIRRETASLVQVESQGIANGLPFQLSAEARRSGDCQ